MNSLVPEHIGRLQAPTLYQQRIAELPLTLLQHFQRAVQVGVWDNGSILTQAQMRACQCALDTWQALRASQAMPLGMAVHLRQKV